MVAALAGVVDDLVGSFPCGAKLSLGKVSSRCGDRTQDEVTYVELSELYLLVVVFGHLLLVFRHSLGNFVSYFVQTVQVDLQVIVIVLFIECLLLDAGYSYLDRDHCFRAIGESEGQDVGQFFWPGTLCVVQLCLDNLE